MKGTGGRVRPGDKKWKDGVRIYNDCCVSKKCLRNMDEVTNVSRFLYFSSSGNVYTFKSVLYLIMKSLLIRCCFM